MKAKPHAKVHDTEKMSQVFDAKSSQAALDEGDDDDDDDGDEDEDEDEDDNEKMWQLFDANMAASAAAKSAAEKAEMKGAATARGSIGSHDAHSLDKQSPTEVEKYMEKYMDICDESSDEVTKLSSHKRPGSAVSSSRSSCDSSQPKSHCTSRSRDEPTGVRKRPRSVSAEIFPGSPCDQFMVDAAEEVNCRSGSSQNLGGKLSGRKSASVVEKSLHRRKARNALFG